jgi:hypothetical protein
MKTIDAATFYNSCTHNQMADLVEMFYTRKRTIVAYKMKEFPVGTIKIYSHFFSISADFPNNGIYVKIKAKFWMEGILCLSEIKSIAVFDDVRDWNLHFALECHMEMVSSPSAPAFYLN